MHNRNQIRYAAGALYAAAIVLAIFVGGLIPVIIVGAILLGIVYTVVGRRGQTEPGRERNRNRNRNRNRGSD